MKWETVNSTRTSEIFQLMFCSKSNVNITFLVLCLVSGLNFEPLGANCMYFHSCHLKSFPFWQTHFKFHSKGSDDNRNTEGEKKISKKASNLRRHQTKMHQQRHHRKSRRRIKAGLRISYYSSTQYISVQ